MVSESISSNKRGLVLEGGSMRGLFTCGILDVFMENGLACDGVVGVSAGAAFGCNIKSKQPGRAVRYNKNYCLDKRYVSYGNLFKTGNIFGVEFCYKTIPFELDPWDVETFRNNPMEFYVVATDVVTGCPVYKKLTDGTEEDVEWIRASASMPLLSTIVDINGLKLLDGGVSDSVPLKFFESIGYSKNIVILTQPEGYVKQKNKMIPLAKVMLRKYPEMIRIMADRHERYNANTAYIEKRAKEGDVFLIRPDEPLGIANMVKSQDEIERVYQIGRKKGEEVLAAAKAFLGE